MFNKLTVQQTFQRAAATYDAASALTQEVGQRLLEHLDWMRITPQRILDLGAGTGYISELLQKKYPGSEIIALDFTENMLKQSQRNHPSLLQTCGAAEQLPFADHSFDLIVSNLMLPWCQELALIFSEAKRTLTSTGLFLFSTFGPDTLGELRASFATVDDSAHVHLFFDLHDIGDALLQAGFSDPVMQSEWLTMAYSDTKTLFADLKNSGSINIWEERRQTLTGKNKFQRFLAEYETYRNEEARLPATFEVIYGHCWRKENSQKQTGEFSVMISDIKKNHTEP